jgi:hypothetical protein
MVAIKANLNIETKLKSWLLCKMTLMVEAVLKAINLAFKTAIFMQFYSIAINKTDNSPYKKRLLAFYFSQNKK